MQNKGIPPKLTIFNKSAHINALTPTFYSPMNTTSPTLTLIPTSPDPSKHSALALVPQTENLSTSQKTPSQDPSTSSSHNCKMAPMEDSPNAGNEDTEDDVKESDSDYKGDSEDLNHLNRWSL